uniref:Uncharacterized protein n=1 Tax=Anabas testudineus TaxID=64144 RepID=A0A7N6AE86_ANATE
MHLLFILVTIVTTTQQLISFQLGPVTSSLIQAKHTSAVGQSESVNFTLRATFTGHGCHVEGSSVSASWYSLFDNGTNYCNLYNIIQGSGLSKAPGFTEFTNEWLCLGYKRSMCN